MFLQLFVFLPTVVQETLTYAALLRLPGSMSHKQKVERVDTVLEALGLVKSKDTIIGELPAAALTRAGLQPLAPVFKMLRSVLVQTRVGESFHPADSTQCTCQTE